MKQHKKLTEVFSWILLATMVLPRQVLAQEAPQVVISEVNWGGSSQSNADEWLELQNLWEEAIDLGGWSIEGAGASGSTITLPTGSTVGPYGTYLISNYASNNSTLAVAPDYVTTNVSLSNSALRLVLRTGNGTVVDAAGDGGRPMAGNVPGSGDSGSGGASMIRGADDWTTAAVSSGFDPGIAQFGTPGTGDVPVTRAEESEPEVLVVEETSVEAEHPGAEESPSEPEPQVEVEAPATEETPAEAPTNVGAMLASPEVETPIVTEPPTELSSADIEETPTDAGTIRESPEGAEEPPLEEEDVEDTASDGEEIHESSAIDERSPTEETSDEEVASETMLASPTSYAIGTLIVNEVSPAPTEGNEWVEIYNPFNNVISLKGWHVTEGGGTKVALDGFLGFAQFTTVEFVNRLNNTGDTVRLVDPTGATIDTLTFGKEVKSGMSASRDDEGRVVATLTPTRYSENVITVAESKTEAASTTEAEKETSATKTTTKAKTEAAVSVDRPTTLRITSLLPDPAGADEEFEEVEIENFGDASVPLAGWILTDSATKYKLVGELGAHLRLTLPRPATHLALNNTSDTLSLVAPDSEVADQIMYEDAIEAAHYARSDEGWTWTGVLAATESADVSDTACEGTSATGAGTDSVKSKPKSGSAKSTKSSKSSASVQSYDGVVIAPPGIFGTQIMYGDGLQLYQYNGDFPLLEVGDVVQARGTTSTNHGEARLKLASGGDLVIVGHEDVEAEESAVSDLGPMVGRLVVVEGMITARAGDRFTIEQNGAELSVIAKESTEISLSSLSVGNTVRVTGVLSTYDGKLRLLPRFQTDIANATAESGTTSGTVEEPTAPSSPLRPIGFGLIGATLLGLGGRWLAVNRKQKQIKLIARPVIA